LIAFDAKTGEQKWSASREKYRASYSTPIVIERAGKKELVCGTTTGIDAYNPQDGQVLWSYPIKWEAGSMPLRAVAGPVLLGDKIALAMGDGGGSRYMVTIAAGLKGPSKVWDLKKDSPYVPTVISHVDHVYWVNDAGLAVCADAKTGKTIWSERVFGRGAVSSSPILIQDTILILAEDGTAVAFKASAEGFEKVGESKIGESVFATPAVANGRLLIRGATHLFCYGPKGS
jgi:outer membrane protein assembly factor BamB